MQIIERNHEDTAYCLHLRDCLVHVRKCQKNILASSSAVEEEGASETKDNKIVSKVEQHFIEICNIVE